MKYKSWCKADLMRNMAQVAPCSTSCSTNLPLQATVSRSGGTAYIKQGFLPNTAYIGKCATWGSKLKYKSWCKADLMRNMAQVAPCSTCGCANVVQTLPGGRQVADKAVELSSTRDSSQIQRISVNARHGSGSWSANGSAKRI